MKNRKTLITVLLAGILLVAGCNNKPAETTTAATEATTAATEATTPAETTAAASEAENTAGSEETEADTEEEPADTDEPEINPDNAVTDADHPFGETILEENVNVSLRSAYENLNEVISSGSYTYIMDSTVDYGGSDLTMSTVMACDPGLGTYSDINAVFITTKTLSRPDGTLYIIDDENRYYVKTTSEESGMTVSNDAGSSVMPVKEEVNTAELVALPTGEKYYRFTITPENNASETEYTSNVYVYTDLDCTMRGMYANVNGSETKMRLEIRTGADAALFELPADYEEITYEEYQKRLLESLGSLFSSDDSSEDGQSEE